MQKGLKKILLVEDDHSLRSSLGMFLERNGYSVDEVSSAEEAVRHLQMRIYDLVVTDYKLHGKDGMWLLGSVCADYPETNVLVMSAYADVEIAVSALKMGAVDFLMKPFTPPAFISRCKSALEFRRTMETTKAAENLTPASFHEIVGRSLSVKKMKDLLRSMEGENVNLLLSGEIGVGKQTLARKIHERSGKSGFFVVVDCAALETDELEKVLFDPESGALQKACDGTLYLAQVGALDLSLQSKILRRIEMEDKDQSSALGVRGLRLICSTSTNLEHMIEQEAFLKDFYYRINVIHLEIEPLRHRVEDIPVLADYFLRGYASARKKEIRGFDKESMDILCKYDWPGNIRELGNVVERAVIFCNREVIEPEYIHENVRFPKKTNSVGSATTGIQTLREMEKEKILETLKMFGGNRATTAKVLGIGRNTLWRKLKEYEIEE